MTMRTSCPDDLTLLSFAAGATDAPRVGERIAAHVEQCESCRATVMRHRALAADVRRATRETTDPRGECLDELALAAFAEGVATDEERAAATAHLVTCASCRSQLAELRATLDDAAVAAALPHAGATHPLRWTLVRRASVAGLAA